LQKGKTHFEGMNSNSSPCLLSQIETMLKNQDDLDDRLKEVEMDHKKARDLLQSLKCRIDQSDQNISRVEVFLMKEA